jgi:hypothetical protein
MYGCTHKDATIVELGACTGLETRVSACAAPKVHIVAVEPSSHLRAVPVSPAHNTAVTICTRNMFGSFSLWVICVVLALAGRFTIPLERC